MGFSGGGSNILKPHTHDSNIVQDGGSLNMQNVTQSNMSAGSVTYSDGNHLQELGIGGAGQQLVVNAGATAPEWATEHGLHQISTQNIDFATLFTTTSASYVDITGLSLTVPNRAGIHALVTFSWQWQNTVTSTDQYFRILNNGVSENDYIKWVLTGNGYFNSLGTSNDTPNSVVKLQAHTNGVATCNVYGTAGGKASKVVSLEVS